MVSSKEKFNDSLPKNKVVRNKLHYHYIPPCYISSNKVDLEKINTIYFSNEYGIGDNFVARSFIKKVVETFPDKEFYSIHQFGPTLLKDIPQVKEIKSKDYKDKFGKKIPFWVDNKTRTTKNPIGYDQLAEDEFGGLHINTWYHSLQEMASKYYNGSAFPVLIYNFQHLFYALGMKEIKNAEDYLPSVDYSYYDTGPLTNKLEEIRKKFDKVVLVCNEVPSTKDIVRRFDFDSFLVPKVKSNPRTAFIHTVPMDSEQLRYLGNVKNVFYTDNILSKKDKPDVIYMGFIAKYCDTIIGRMSGPMACTLTKEHLVDKPKQFLATTDWPMLCEWAMERDSSKLDYVSPFDPQEWWSLLGKHFGDDLQKGTYSFG